VIYKHTHTHTTRLRRLPLLSKQCYLCLGLRMLLFHLLLFSVTLVAGVGNSNILFIMYDDLRTELSIYGRSHMITPNFERLASRSVVFDYAFCQIAVCNPSRDSMLTGLRPDTVGTYGWVNERPCLFWSFKTVSQVSTLFSTKYYIPFTFVAKWL
jgi:hypothetical protein